MKLCIEKDCSFVGSASDFHDLYCTGEYYCPDHLEQHAQGRDTEDMHIDSPTSCKCESRIKHDPDYFLELRDSLQIKNDELGAKLEKEWKETSIWTVIWDLVAFP
jgi:hypothetical protein